MSTAYRIDVFDTAGVIQFVLTDFLSVAWERRVNSPGLMTLRMGGDHPLLASLADKWQFELWRKPDGLDWSREITGIYRASEWRYEDSSTFDAILPGLMSMLSWRHVFYPANTTDRSRFLSKSAEYVMKTMVAYNAGVVALVSNGRLRNGVIPGVTVQPIAGGGNTVDWYCAYDNLLKSLQKLAEIAGGDFDLVPTSQTSYEFRFYPGQLGTDRSAEVRFGMQHGNMSDPVYIDNRSGEITVALVAGKGEETEREYVVRTGTNYSASNDIETFINANDVEPGQTAALNTRGDQALNGLQAINNLDFRVLQTSASRYREHYDLGDLVTEINPRTGGEVKKKVTAIIGALDEDGSEQIDVELMP